MHRFFSLITLVGATVFTPAYGRTQSAQAGRVLTSPAPPNDHGRKEQVDLSAATAKKLNAKPGTSKASCPVLPPSALSKSCPERAQSSIAIRNQTGSQLPPNQTPSVIDAPGRRGVLDLRAAVDKQPLQINGSYLAITTGPRGIYHNLVLDGFRVLGSKREGVRVEGDVRNVTFRHFDIQHDASINRPPDLPTGFNVRSGSGILIEDGHISGNRMTGLKYPNGDGLNIEKGVTNVTIRRVVSENHSDSAFDLLKGSNIRLENVTGRNAARCVKTGAVHVVVTNITCVGVQTAIELHGNDITIDTLVYDPGGRTAKSWLFSTNAGSAGQASLTVKRCMAPNGGPIRLPTADSIWLAKGKGVTVSLGPSCRRP